MNGIPFGLLLNTTVSLSDTSPTTHSFISSEDGWRYTHSLEPVSKMSELVWKSTDSGDN